VDRYSAGWMAAERSKNTMRKRLHKRRKDGYNLCLR
jgi:hypothetical protein